MTRTFPKQMMTMTCRQASWWSRIAVMGQSRLHSRVLCKTSSSSAPHTPTCATSFGQRSMAAEAARSNSRLFSTLVDKSTIHGPMGSYQDEYDASIQDPKSFWKTKADDLVWFQKPQRILQERKQSSSNVPSLYDWFPDGVLNTCYNCLDVHIVQGRGDQVALIYDSPMTGQTTPQTFTYQELHHEVVTLAKVLQERLNVQMGDRVILYMPMIPQAVVAMLACTRIGAIHSVVFGGFASKELATRITDCQPKLILSTSVGIEPSGAGGDGKQPSCRVVEYKPLLERALELANHNVQHCVIVQRPDIPILRNSNVSSVCTLKSPMDLDYQHLMDEYYQMVTPVSSKDSTVTHVPSNHPHYILYTSGTTGTPKGVVRDTGGYAVALKYTMNMFYDTKPGDVIFTASDIGWVVGHSYTVYGPLLNGCTTVLYEGKPVGTPDAGAFWRVIQEHSVKTLFVAPTAFRAIKQADPTASFAAKYDLSTLKGLFLAGEHSDPATLHYCKKILAKYGDVVDPVDHWWMTELGWPGVGNALGLGRMPLRYGACTAPVPGYDISVVNESGDKVSPGELGDMVIKTPLPPGTLTTLYNNEDGYVQSYLSRYPGFFDTGDAALIDEDGYIHVMGRTDDIINTAGHRLSTGGLEEIVQSHAEVAECAVIPVKDDIKGEVPVGFVVVNQGSSMEHDRLKDELIKLVRNELGPVASFKKVAIVKKLPKTRSGKILRGTMSKIANGESYKITPTVEDPDIFTYLEPEIHRLMES